MSTVKSKNSTMKGKFYYLLSSRRTGESEWTVVGDWGHAGEAGPGDRWCCHWMTRQMRHSMLPTQRPWPNAVERWRVPHTPTQTDRQRSSKTWSTIAPPFQVEGQRELSKSCDQTEFQISTQTWDRANEERCDSGWWLDDCEITTNNDGQMRGEEGDISQRDRWETFRPRATHRYLLWYYRTNV